MSRTTIRVTFDKTSAMSLIKAAGDEALTAVGIQALHNANMYVPEDQGTLGDSGIYHSSRKAENGMFTLRWDEPYSQYLWHGDIMYGNPDTRTYGPEKLNFTSALARAEWAKYAEEVYGEEWEKAFQAALKRGLQD